MMKLVVTRTRHLPTHPDRITLSSDGRRGLLRHTRNHHQVIDITSGQVMCEFDLPLYHGCRLSPDGLRAVIYSPNTLRVIDCATGDTLVRAPIRGKHLDACCFTRDGRYLWCSLQYPVRGTYLALFDTQHLKLVDLAHFLRGYLRTTGIRAPSDLLAVEKIAGDSFLGVDFFRQIDGKIVREPHSIQPGNDIRPFLASHFADDGQHYAAIDGPFLWVWRLPDLQLIGNGCRGLAALFRGKEGINKGIEDFALLGKHAVVAAYREDFGVDAFIEELHLVDIEPGVIIDSSVLPIPIRRGQWDYGFLCAFGGNTLAGLTEDAALFYHVAWESASGETSL